MVLTFISLQAIGQARGNQGKNCGKVCSGDSGLGGDGVSESEVKH